MFENAKKVILDNWERLTDQTFAPSIQYLVQKEIEAAEKRIAELDLLLKQAFESDGEKHRRAVELQVENEQLKTSQSELREGNRRLKEIIYHERNNDKSISDSFEKVQSENYCLYHGNEKLKKELVEVLKTQLTEMEAMRKRIEEMENREKCILRNKDGVEKK